MNNISKVNVWEEAIIILTYETGKPDKNPLFLEKRVYQGSSGKVYPHSVIDKISDTKTDKALAENCNTFQIATHYQLLF